MSKTKEKILLVSKKMFNEKGFGNVTIRMIALKLNMSSGNLNYHFKKREDILEALYFEMVATFDDRIKELGTTDISLETVKEDIEGSLVRMLDYRFFWTDLYNLLRLNHKIKDHFLGVYEARYKGTQLLFELLRAKGILHGFEFEKESNLLIERMIAYNNTWLYNSFIYELVINDAYVEAFSENLLGMLYPYFTDLGKNHYKMLFS